MEGNENPPSPGARQGNDSLDAFPMLERRVARLEAYLQLPPLPEAGGEAEPVAAGSRIDDEASLEFRIGEFYLAQAGILALIFGVGLLVTYLYTFLPSWISSTGAYLLAGGTLLAGKLSRKFFPPVSLAIFSGGFLLLFYATLRLSFFTPDPLLADPRAGVAAMAAVVGLQAAFSVRMKSQLLGIIALLCGYAAALIADDVHITLSLLGLASVLAAYFRLRHNWESAVVLAIIATDVAFLAWVLGNPLLSHPIGLRSDGFTGLYYLYGYAAIFAGANLFRSRSLAYETSNILLSLFNAAGFYLIAMLLVCSNSGADLALHSLLAAAFLLGIAVAYWLLRKSFYSASFYSLGGFFALSVAIFARFNGPERFILLAWQSILVIMTAIWFRSRIITFGNLVIYSGIYLFYHVTTAPDAWVHLNYAIVAILSARLLNIKKGQLDFGTEFLRNVYLTATFFLIPYGLSLAVPPQFVSLSWLGASVFYFTMSFILSNQKYRWMGILNILLVLGRVLLVDLAKLEAVYRIVSFVVLGIVLLVISLVYAARRSRRSAAFRKEAEGE